MLHVGEVIAIRRWTEDEMLLVRKNLFFCLNRIKVIIRKYKLSNKIAKFIIHDVKVMD